MNPHYHDWATLLLRWLHLTTGIAWIGASFYFVFLENNLNRTDNLRDDLSGDLWAIHGGGIYHLDKYKNAPPVFPKHLHWFKWEAYWTWMSGMLLLVAIYYVQAATYLLDPSKSSIGVWTAIAISAGSIAISWIAYDLLCRSPLLERPFWLGLICFGFSIAMLYGLLQIYSNRAAFIHLGAILGTVMAGNVFCVIIPSQKALVAAAQLGESPDPKLGRNAGKRSRHNNYITLPVLFIMISNHYPVIYENPHNWLIFSVLAFGSGLVRHYFNIRKEVPASAVILPASALGVILLAYATSPGTTPRESREVAFHEIEGIMKQRCQSCHSSNPTDDIFKIPPNGFLLDNEEQIKAAADRIYSRVVTTKNMPFMNKTGMTDDERELIADWIAGLGQN